MPVFKQYSKSPYNWTADWRQIRVLKGARKGGKYRAGVCELPPWWMTVTGDSAGAVSTTESNLSPKNYRPYAQFLADVVQYFAAAAGVQFYTLDPFNEPVEGFWHKGRPHEGCFLLPSRWGP